MILIDQHTDAVGGRVPARMCCSALLVAAIEGKAQNEGYSRGTSAQPQPYTACEQQEREQQQEQRGPKWAEQGGDWPLNELFPVCFTFAAACCVLAFCFFPISVIPPFEP